MVVNEEIKVINRKKGELLAGRKSVEPKVVGANVDYSEALEDDNYEEQCCT